VFGVGLVVLSRRRGQCPTGRDAVESSRDPIVDLVLLGLSQPA